MHAGDRQRNFTVTVRQHQFEVAAVEGELVVGGDFTRDTQAEVHHFAAPAQAAPVAGELIIGVDHGDAARREVTEHRAVFRRHISDRFHELLMLALRVVDQRHCRLGDVSKIVDLARMIHAELDHADNVVRAQAQQRERQADLVVQVALG